MSMVVELSGGIRATWNFNAFEVSSQPMRNTWSSQPTDSRDRLKPRDALKTPSGVRPSEKKFVFPNKGKSGSLHLRPYLT